MSFMLYVLYLLWINCTLYQQKQKTTNRKSHKFHKTLHWKLLLQVHLGSEAECFRQMFGSDHGSNALKKYQRHKKKQKKKAWHLFNLALLKHKCHSYSILDAGSTYSINTWTTNTQLWPEKRSNSGNHMFLTSKASNSASSIMQQTLMDLVWQCAALRPNMSIGCQIHLK